MEQKYTLAEAARILGEMFINMANSLEIKDNETCSPECEKRCLGECGGDKCKKHHNDSIDAIAYAMKGLDKINNEKQEYYELVGKLRADLDNTHRYIENFCKKESDCSDPDKAVKDALTKCCEEKKKDFEKKISNGNNKAVKEELRKHYEQQKEDFCKKVSNISKDEKLKLAHDRLSSTAASCFKVPVSFIFGNSGIDEDTMSLLEIIGETEEVVQMVKDTKMDLIKKLSKETGRGLFECKDALIRCDYDYDKAKQYLENKPYGLCNILT